jgi:hypothetical protein
MPRPAPTSNIHRQSARLLRVAHRCRYTSYSPRLTPTRMWLISNYTIPYPSCQVHITLNCRSDRFFLFRQSRSQLSSLLYPFRPNRGRTLNEPEATMIMTTVSFGNKVCFSISIYHVCAKTSFRIYTSPALEAAPTKSSLGMAMVSRTKCEEFDTCSKLECYR